MLLLGQGQRLRNLLDVDGGVDRCSRDYTAGAVTGAAVLIVGTLGVGTEVVGTTVIGSYPGYVALAEGLGANYFSIPAADWASMTAAEQWAANQAFLDAAIARGDAFIVSNWPAQAGTFFEREVQYLLSRGIAVGP
jgi:hypothetical protein